MEEGKKGGKRASAKNKALSVQRESPVSGNCKVFHHWKVIGMKVT